MKDERSGDQSGVGGAMLPIKRCGRGAFATKTMARGVDAVETFSELVLRIRTMSPCRGDEAEARAAMRRRGVAEAAFLAQFDRWLRSLASTWRRGTSLEMDDLAQIARLATLAWLRGDVPACYASRPTMFNLRCCVRQALRGAVREARLVRGVAGSRLVGIDDIGLDDEEAAS